VRRGGESAEIRKKEPGGLFGQAAGLFFSPAVISSVAVGLMWSFIFHPTIGLLNQLLHFAGLESLARQWLLDPKTALWAIAFVTSWQYAGYSMVLFLAGIQNIPPNIFESAKIDGAGPLAVIRHITLPMIKPIIKVNTILITVGSLKFFDLVYAMTGGRPVHRTEVLASHIYTRSFQYFEYGYGKRVRERPPDRSVRPPSGLAGAGRAGRLRDGQCDGQDPAIPSGRGALRRTEGRFVAERERPRANVHREEFAVAECGGNHPEPRRCRHAGMPGRHVMLRNAVCHGAGPAHALPGLRRFFCPAIDPFFILTPVSGIGK